MPGQHYPSLFIITNAENTRWFKVEENSAEEIKVQREPHDHYSDNEGFFASSGGGMNFGGGAPDLKNSLKDAQLHGHTRNMAEETTRLWKEGSYVHLSIATPEQYKNIVEEEVENWLPGVEIKFVYGNYGHADKNEIKDLFVESLRPQD